MPMNSALRRSTSLPLPKSRPARMPSVGLMNTSLSMQRCCCARRPETSRKSPKSSISRTYPSSENSSSASSASRPKPTAKRRINLLCCHSSSRSDYCGSAIRMSILILAALALYVIPLTGLDCCGYQM